VITAKEGFYQCVDLHVSSPNNNLSHEDIYQTGDRGENARRDSVSTVSTLESELDAPTLPTTWSPHSSPSRFGGEKSPGGVIVRTLSMDSQVEVDEAGAGGKSLELSRMRTFGERDATAKETESWRIENLPGRNSVGVAF